MTIQEQIKAKREAAGLVVTYMTTDPITGERQPFTVYPANEAQKAAYIAKARAAGTLVA